jgi:uncharacterized protein (UPF0276 family)
MCATPTPKSKQYIHGVGVGLRQPHFKEITENKPRIPWLEAHTENYFYPDSPSSKYLDNITQDYPISLHGVGLSLGSSDGINQNHLRKIKETIGRYQPTLVSEHISWSNHDSVSVPDLLPVPLTQEAFSILKRNIETVQDYLGRQILVENPSSYLAYKQQDMHEYEMMTELAKQTGCGILLDINNIHVSCHNLKLDALEYLGNIPPNLVQEIHLAGYNINKVGGEEIFIDHHGAKVFEDVWALYAEAISHLGDVPTLIEWDTDIPELNILLEEAQKAEIIRTNVLEKKAS